MTALVVERGLAETLGGGAEDRPVVVARRRARRGRGWTAIAPDAVVEALESAGTGALALARGASADPGARALPEVARLMGREVIRLPDDALAAAWTVAMALAWEPEPALARRLQVLVGAAGGAPALPRRRMAGIVLPAVRPRVLARWAGCVWRPCPSCAGGGLPGAPCGRCGVGVIGAGA